MKGQLLLAELPSFILVITFTVVIQEILAIFLPVNFIFSV